MTLSITSGCSGCSRRCECVLVCVCVHPLSEDHGRGSHFQIRCCLFGLSCSCLLRQPSLSAWRSVNIRAAGNFGIVFPSLFLSFFLCTQRAKVHAWIFQWLRAGAECLPQDLQSRGGGDMTNGCEGRMVCIAASDWHLLFYILHLFLPCEFARRAAAAPAAFYIQRWITATLRTGSLPTEGEKMLI